MKKEIKTIIVATLVAERNFRERSRKETGFAILLKRRHPELRGIEDSRLAHFLQEHSTMDRAWRQALERDPLLRGTDYSRKTILAQRKMLSLGYEPGMHRVGREVEERVARDEDHSPTPPNGQNTAENAGETAGEGRGGEQALHESTSKLQ